MSPPAEESKRWLDQPDSGKKLFWALAAACLGLLAWDLGYHQHGHLDFEEWFGFHAWFGFLAYCFIVGSAVMMRKVLKRPEDYYDAE
tara:strand:+ start:1507 stop:1767 length:261 start_codon:yes stop_codon:yes gene_type:complete